MDTENVLFECTECNSEVNQDEIHVSDYDNSTMLCDDCARFCERCNVVGMGDDNWCWIYDNDRWCESCTENFANWCSGCEQYHCDDTYFMNDRSGSFCMSCADEAEYCDDCDEYYMDGCGSHGGGQLIHDYSYRPDPIFHSTDSDERLFFGMEIEVETSRDRVKSATYAQKLEEKDLAYLKNDGSLNCGFEIVTHPMTHDYYKNEAQYFWDVLENLRTDSEIRVKSWDTRTCGVHIHISRAGFNGGAHMHRFLSLVYSNQALYEAIAGRSSTQWAKFDDVDSAVPNGRNEDGYTQWKTVRSFKNKIQQGRNTDRYSAVNTQNAHTLEMRIFRGTVNQNTLKAYLDLAHASVEYTRNLRVSDVTCGALQDVVFAQYVEENAALYPDLCARIAKVYPQILSDNLTRIG